ncbi:MAG: L-threonylcarbamoyladenylate synthase [Pseudomonadota bacterium]
MLISINIQTPQPRLINQIVDLLQKGGVIAYPTDTYYGIGCDIMNKKAIERVYQIKQRDRTQPFSFICADLKHISDYALVTNFAYRTMKRLLPGPYTFILPGSKMVPRIMLTKRKTAGIRVPDNAIAVAIARELGHPILSTSATDPDGVIFEDASLLHDVLGNRLEAVIDGGPVPGRASSVISLVDDEPEILREGAGDISFFEE